ncbi:MAG: isoprenyl transferase [Peptococcaceae bacterium]|nr:isoprenyl transferase [Peptococcaceae bacterium]
MNRIPTHIAIIMDGNGRWAALRGMPRAVGHRAGVEALREIVRTCDALGVKYLTVYAFSTENWKRPQSEIGILMSLLKEYVRKELGDLHANHVQIRVLGNIEQLPPDVREAILLACEKTKDNTGLIFNLAVNYGGRAELLHAVKSIVKDVQAGKLDEEKINEESFENYLYTGGCPEPDLLIRTSGEMRISNFLLWQVAYSEFVVVNECWPDFNEKSLIEAVRIFQNRDRRFGGIKKVEE